MRASGCINVVLMALALLTTSPALAVFGGLPEKVEKQVLGQGPKLRLRVGAHDVGLVRPNSRRDSRLERRALGKMGAYRLDNTVQIPGVQGSFWKRRKSTPSVSLPRTVADSYLMLVHDATAHDAEQTAGAFRKLVEIRDQVTAPGGGA